MFDKRKKEKKHSKYNAWYTVACSKVLIILSISNNMWSSIISGKDGCNGLLMVIALINKGIL